MWFAARVHQFHCLSQAKCSSPSYKFWLKFHSTWQRLCKLHYTGVTCSSVTKHAWLGCAIHVMCCAHCQIVADISLPCRSAGHGASQSDDDCMHAAWRMSHAACVDATWAYAINVKNQVWWVSAVTPSCTMVGGACLLHVAFTPLPSLRHLTKLVW